MVTSLNFASALRAEIRAVAFDLVVIDEAHKFRNGYSLERLATDFGPSALVNKSVALVGEVELSANPQRAKIVEVLKSIVGEDSISINTKYESTFPSLRLPTRFVIASNSVPRLLDASGALAHRFLFVPFEISFIGREDIHLEEKLLAELPGIANWALLGLKRLRAAGGKFTIGDGHKRLSSQYAADTSPIMAWVRSEMVVHRRADPGDLPTECLTNETVSIGKTDAYDNYVDWCDEHDIEPTSVRWFGRDLKTLIPKIKEGRETSADGFRPMVYRGMGVRSRRTVDDDDTKTSGCTVNNQPISSPNGVESMSLSGQSYHLDCFTQLFNKVDNDKGNEIGNDKVVIKKENDLTDLTALPHNDSGGKKRSEKEALRVAMNLRQTYKNGFVIQPVENDLSKWRVGKEVHGKTSWLEQTGTEEWARNEVRRRSALIASN